MLKRQIDWQLYATEGKLTSKDCNLLLGYDQQERQTQQDYLDETGPALAGLFIKILNNVANIETQEYTIILIDQLFAQDKTVEQVKTATGYFLDFARANPNIDIAAPFLQILITSGQHNPFTFLRVQHILAILLSASYGQGVSVRDESSERLTVVQFLRYLISKITTLSSSSPAPGFGSSSSAYASPSSPTASAAATNRELMACLSSLKNLLRSSTKIQELFAEQDGVRALTNLLNKETQNAQLLYLVGFNIWLLSYEKSIAHKLKEFGVIKKLVSVVKVNVMEKVIRISFSILRVRDTQTHTCHVMDGGGDLEARFSLTRILFFLFLLLLFPPLPPQNFLDHRVDSFNEEMIGTGLVPVVETLSKRKFKDPDVLNDMNKIQEVLYETIRNMSTFEKYSVEVMAGTLSWNNPAHKNEIFWRENISSFEGKSFELVQQLIKLADPALGAAAAAATGAASIEREEMVREVACFDLGEFARFHPDGKKVLMRLRGKETLMKNLSDKSPKIAKAALLATQKLMVANWEMLNKASSGGVASLGQPTKK